MDILDIRLRRPLVRRPPFWPIFLISTTAPAIPTKDSCHLWVMFRKLYISRAMAIPSRKTATAEKLLKAKLLKNPLNPLPNLAKGLLPRMNSGVSRAVSSEAISILPTMPPIAPATPPKRPPWAKVKKFIQDSAWLSLYLDWMIPNTIQIAVIMSVGNRIIGCLRVYFSFWK